MVLVPWGSDVSLGILDMSRLTDEGNMWVAPFLWPVMEIVRAAAFLLKNYMSSQLRKLKGSTHFFRPFWAWSKFNPQLSQPNSSQDPDALHSAHRWVTLIPLFLDQTPIEFNTSENILLRKIKESGIFSLREEFRSPTS